MLKRLAKRWVFGWLLFLNLLVTGLLINIILFFAFIPASILLQAKGEPQINETLRTFLMCLGIAYGLIISPLVLPWIVKWKGIPVWSSWDDNPDDEESAPRRVVP
jgi:hypothetical protein